MDLSRQQRRNEKKKRKRRAGRGCRRSFGTEVAVAIIVFKRIYESGSASAGSRFSNRAKPRVQRRRIPVFEDEDEVDMVAKPSLPPYEVIIRHPLEISSQESRPGVLDFCSVGDDDSNEGEDDLMIPRVIHIAEKREGSVSRREKGEGEI